MESGLDLTLRGLIHDLNNVFQTLMEAADLFSDDPRWSPVSATILRCVERGQDIAMSMQTVQQPSALLATVLEDALTFVQDWVTLSHGPQIRFACEVEPGLMLRHPWAWERVLINLFMNAVRAMPAGGTISVDARHTGDGIQIVVADEGCGIAPDLLPRIFEPHVTTKLGGPAAGGLGLHIVHTIVEREDGQVHAANRDGRGAEFTILIPASPPLTQTAIA